MGAGHRVSLEGWQSFGAFDGTLAVEIWSRITQVNYQFDDVRGRFCYKNQCNTVITTGEARVTRRVNQETPICGSISTVVSNSISMVPRLRQTLDFSPTGSLTMPLA